MALGLHENCRARLVERLTELIPQFEYRNGWYLERGTLAGLLDLKKSLPNQKDFRDRLES
jgi:hypothetical protein